MFSRLRRIVDSVPVLARGLRDVRDRRTMASLKRIDSPWGFSLWGGNYLVSGVQEPAELKLVSTALQTTDVLVDCGANAGLFTCLAAARGVHAIAIEPYPLNLSVLYRNLTDNDFKTPVEVYPVALGARPTVASLFGRGQGASLVAGWGDLPIADSISVSVLPLDTVLGNRFTGKRLLVKIDVEGAEWDVLQGARQMLAQRPTVLMELSFSHNHPTGRHPRFKEVLELFWGMNYRIEDPIGTRSEAAITPSRVESWFQRGETDLGGENMWFVPQ